MRRVPEPRFAIVGRLQAKNSLIPIRIVGEANVFDLEIWLLPFPFLRPGEVRLVELLPQPGNFNRIRIREKNSKHGHESPLSSSQRRERQQCLQLRDEAYFGIWT